MKDIMKSYKQKIDLQLAGFFDSRLKRAESVSATARQAFEALREFSLRGGKRIRPMLAIFSYKGFGGRNEPEIIKAALAVELMESYLLIHDDIIDQDELRRGYLTIHKIYENKAKDKHYGASMAIVVGDIACSLGNEAILATGFPADRKLKAIETFNRVIINTCFGQMLDIDSETNPNITEQDILKIHTLKTAIYTIDGPLQIGAILAGAGQRSLEQLSGFAIPLGKAFQIQDDILGLFGSQEKIGKPIGSDVKEGKKTLLILKAMENAAPAQQRFIQKSLGNRKIQNTDVEQIRKIVADTGSLDYSRRLMANCIAEAKSVLERISMAREGKQFMESIADYIVQRDR
jgi:geranylgeranyl diphosphate synthase type I